MREFCLQHAGILFAVCNSFACSELIFLQLLSYLQRVGVLFAVYNSFACSVHIFFYSFLFVCSVLELIFFRRVLYVCKDFLNLQCFLFVKAVSPVGHRSEGCDLGYRKVIFFFRTGLFQTLSCWGRAKKEGEPEKKLGKTRAFHPVVFFTQPFFTCPWQLPRAWNRLAYFIAE